MTTEWRINSTDEVISRAWGWVGVAGYALTFFVLAVIFK